MNVKHFCIAATIGLLGFISCGTQEIDQLQAEKQKLQLQTQKQDSLINEVAAFINQFEDNLEDVLQRRGVIVLVSEDKESSNSTQISLISGHLSAVDSLLTQNQVIIDSLNEKLDAAHGKWYGLQQTVKRLQKKLTESNNDIRQLSHSLGIAQDEIYVLKQAKRMLLSSHDSLLSNANKLENQLALQHSQNKAQARLIQEKEAHLRKAYYVAGSKAELKALDVIETKGGIVGIGQVKTLQDHLKPSAFHPIDMEEKRIFAIHSKKAELISPHPSDSYAFIPSDDGKTIIGLEVIEPERFWETSRYLVVLKD